MLLYLGENPRRFLWCCFCILIFDLHFLVVLHLSMFFILLLFFIHIFFSTSSLTLPWIFTLSLHPFYTLKPSPSKSDSRHFHFQPFRYLLAVSATVFSGHFLPTGAFYLTLFTFNLHLSRLPQGTAVLPWCLQGFILILICLLDSQ